MSDNLVATIDLDLAWRRVKADIQSRREFVRHPYEIELVEANLPDWLDYLGQQLRDGFNPSVPTIADVPKGYGAVRPGALLRLEDRVIYAGCVGRALPAIYSALEWSQGTVDFAYQLAREHDHPEWLKKAFVAWSSFRESSLQIIRDGATHVVVTDITGYYENVDIGTLISDLRQMGVDPEVVALISTCLNRWSSGNGRGIPQGISASDILGKVYLNSIDLALQELGFKHLRYVDDIRIFCQDEVEAKITLLNLTQLLRRRGLNLQSAKTKIHPADEATKVIEAIIPIVKEVKDEFIRKVIEQVGYQGDYLTLAEADRLASQNPAEASADILKEVFDRHFKAENAKFDSTLFHFIITRLGNQNNAHCHEYCLSIFGEHPQETHHILKYLGAIGGIDRTMAGFYDYLTSGHAIYDYQTYLIFEWLGEIDQQPTAELLSIAREITFDHARPGYLRSVCRRLIGRHASVADLERIEASYAASQEPLDRAQILCDLRKMEAGRRNGFLNRARGDNLLCGRAAQLVRENRL